MATQLGSGGFFYEEHDDWAQLPDGWTFHEAPDVAVDSNDRVYVFNRSDHPMIVFEPDGTFVTSWGEEIFARPHGLTIGPDDSLYCVDDNGHCMHKCTPEGKVLLTIGTPNEPAPYQSGKPFNRPTKAALDPKTGEIYISDGYG